MMSGIHYPIVYLSKYHIDSNSYKDFEPALQTVPDKVAYEEPEQISLGCWGWGVGFIVCIFLGGAVGDGPAMALFMFLAFLGLPILFGLYSSNVSGKNNEAKERYIREYNAIVNRRNSIVQSNKDKKSRFTNAIKNNSRSQALQLIYDDIGFVISEERNFKVGASENGFIEIICKSSIWELMRKDIVVSNGVYQFYPDLALIDIDNSIYIDIEIDEPYTFEDSKPIHFIGGDDERNDFFNRIGWTVIRFSEKQVVKQPHEVVIYIKNVYRSLLEVRELDFESNLQYDLRWNQEKSLLLASESYRNNYI